MDVIAYGNIPKEQFGVSHKASRGIFNQVPYLAPP